MVKLTEPVNRLITHPETSKVMATVSPEGLPHMIVCGSLIVKDAEEIIVGEAYMYRAAEYLKANPNVEFMVWKGKQAYSIKAVARERLDSGPEFEKMCDRLDRMGMACVAIWVFDVLEVWDEGVSGTTGDRVI